MPDDTNDTAIVDVDNEDVENNPVDTDNMDNIYQDIDLSEYGYDSVEDLIYAIDSISEDGTNINDSYATGSDEEIAKSMNDSMRSIFGLPYQFSTIVDPPMYSNSGATQSAQLNIGKKYAQKILSVMPVLFLTPGEPAFMDDYGKDARSNIIQSFVDDDGDGTSEVGEGKYYSFNSKYSEYQKYVNICFKALAKYMAIGDIEIPTPKGNNVALSNLRLDDLLAGSFTKFFGANSCIPFYVDAETSISEDFSNSTTESSLSQAANQFSSKARELKFIMGNDGSGLANTLQDLSTSAAEAVTEVAGDVADAFAGNSFISRVANELTTVVSGGKIVFPEIWSDSSYSRSYNITLKLRSPDPDPVSIFLNIYCPIILLICMAAPRQLNNSANSIESPFIVRATYKSIFTCDMGIISSLSIRKGGEALWNTMGMPTSADVDISIHDMYQSMSISKSQGIINNTALLDYLAVMAGADLNEFEATRTIKLAMSIYSDKPRSYALDRWNAIKEGLNNTAAGFLGHFSDVRYLR